MSSLTKPSLKPLVSLKKPFEFFYKSLLFLIIHFYRTFLSGIFGGNCRFYPSCSCYAEQCLRQHPPHTALILILKRLLKCRPFGGKGVDLVPPYKEKGSSI